MFRIKRVEKFADADVWSKKWVPGFYFSRAEALEAAKFMALKIEPFHPSYRVRVYGNDRGWWADMPYGRYVAFDVYDKGVFY